jgi:hypothetical protein
MELIGNKQFKICLEEMTPESFFSFIVGRRGARHSPPSPSAVLARFAIFSFFTLVVRRFPATTEGVVFG